MSTGSDPQIDPAAAVMVNAIVQAGFLEQGEAGQHRRLSPEHREFIRRARFKLRTPPSTISIWAGPKSTRPFAS